MTHFQENNSESSKCWACMWVTDSPKCGCAFEYFHIDFLLLLSVMVYEYVCVCAFRMVKVFLCYRSMTLTLVKISSLLFSLLGNYDNTLIKQFCKALLLSQKLPYSYHLSSSGIAEKNKWNSQDKISQTFRNIGACLVHSLPSCGLVTG